MGEAHLRHDGGGAAAGAEAHRSPPSGSCPTNRLPDGSTASANGFVGEWVPCDVDRDASEPCSAREP